MIAEDLIADCGLRKPERKGDHKEFNFRTRISDILGMQKEEFRKRTMKFGLRVIRVVDFLPRNQVAAVLGNQLLRAGTAVGANYRAAARGKSRADFILKWAMWKRNAMSRSIGWKCW